MVMLGFAQSHFMANIKLNIKIVNILSILKGFESKNEEENKIKKNVNRRIKC